MKLNFRKIASALASAIMLSSTIGFAAAASYPAPFVEDGVADAAVVYGANAASSDAAAAVNIRGALDAFVDPNKKVYSGDGWTVGTTSDDLEIGESIADVESFIDSDSLSILESGTLTNEKGTAKYDQQFYFYDTVSSKVAFEEDEELTEDIGLFYTVDDGTKILEYIIDFTTALKSDITATDDLQDISDKEIVLLGKSYTITRAVNGTGGVELDLMSGAEKTTLSNGEQITTGGRSVSVLVSSSTEAKFTIDGEDTDKLGIGDTYKLINGAYIGVTDITYQEYAGGLAQATFFVGGDKLELSNGDSLIVNTETISETTVTIDSSETNSDISISEINISMTAPEDLWVPIGGKLSEIILEAGNDEGILFGGNWDIVFNGLGDAEYEEVRLQPTSNNEKYQLSLDTVDSESSVDIPLLYATASALLPGYKDGRPLNLNATNVIVKNDYFVLANGDPTDPGSDARSFVIQYKGVDYDSDGSKATFGVLGQSDDVTKEFSGNSFSIKLGGYTYDFNNASASNEDDFNISLAASDLNGVSVMHVNATGGGEDAVRIYLRTKENTLIEVCQTDDSDTTADWNVTVSVDDTDRDDDDSMLTNGQKVFSVVLSYDGTDDEITSSAVSSSVNLLEDPNNDDKTMGITNYGAEVTVIDSSSAPADITAMIPDNFVSPDVVIAEGDVEITSGSTGSSVSYVTDASVSSVSSKNLIIVGGSCINTVAAKLLNSNDPICGTAFTAKTTVGVGGYLIEVFDNPYDAGDKIAMLVAGYEATDTTRAAADVADGISEDIAIGTKIVNPTVA